MWSRQFPRQTQIVKFPKRGNPVAEWLFYRRKIMTKHELFTIAQALFFILVSALGAAAAVAMLLSLIQVLQPQRKHYWERFRYSFANWTLPACVVIELVFWLITGRWILGLP
jgi:hypothetical protein